eukprot:137998_1
MVSITLIYAAHVLVISSILSVQLINGYPLGFHGEYIYSSMIAGKPVYSYPDQQLYNDGQKWIIYDKKNSKTIAECINVINNERPDLSDQYCQSWKFMRPTYEEAIVSTTDNWYDVSFKACGEHEESIHCTADCNSCLTNSCALLNKCMKRMDVDGKNTAIFIQCDASTNYEWIWKDYMGLTFCDETPWKTSNSKDRETGAAKKCTSTSTSCNEKLVFIGW